MTCHGGPHTDDCDRIVGALAIRQDAMSEMRATLFSYSEPELLAAHAAYDRPRASPLPHCLEFAAVLVIRHNED